MTDVFIAKCLLIHTDGQHERKILCEDLTVKNSDDLLEQLVERNRIGGVIISFETYDSDFNTFVELTTLKGTSY